jgi:hypothetical protein
MKTINAHQFWNSHPINDSEARAILGPIELSFRRENNELWLKTDYANQEPDPKNYLNIRNDWTRYVTSILDSEIKFIPRLPDKGVVVRLEQDFYLAANSTTRIYVRVPVWIRLTFAKNDPSSFIEIPASILSLTWFGSFTRGELCYWISSSARRTYKRDENRPHLAICPIQITNETAEPLPVSKLRIKVETLSLYIDQQQLWGSETQLNYRGAEAISKVQVSSEMPPEVPLAKKISEPRRAINRTMSLRTFSSLFKQISFEI